MGHKSASAGPETKRVELGDGRSLAYLEVGDPNGRPLVSHHGGLSCRLDVVPADASAKAHGLRLIAPDRPGIGQSDPKPGHTMAGWADDVRELVDQLDIDRFATMGWSYGGGFAQTVGRHLADRVDVMVLVASVIPPDWSGMREDIDRMDQVFLKLSESGAGRVVERSILHLMSASAKHATKRFEKMSGLDGDFADAVAAAIAEGVAHGSGVIAEYEIMGTSWGFDPSEITVPTQIWQGDADDLVPPDWGPRLHESIAGSSFTLVPGATHFLWYDHWDDIFDAINGAAAR